MKVTLIPLVAVMLALGGCGLEVLPPCEFCALDEDAGFSPDQEGGLLAFGLTVQPPGAADAPLKGEVQWLAENGQSFTDLRRIAFPEDLVPGQRRLVLWRVPAGTWSLRLVSWSQKKAAGASISLGGHALAAEIPPGGVVYVGDLTLDGHQEPAALTVGDDTADTRDELALRQPAITAPLSISILKDMRTPTGGPRKPK